MSTGTRIAAFVLALGAVFTLAFLAGSAFEPADTEAGGGHDEMTEEYGGDAHGGHGADPEATPGLAVAAAGYALRLDPVWLEPGEAGQLRFRIEGVDGEAVREFDREHERRLHLIVVRRDGAGFQHLHPTMDAGGNWTTQLTLPAAGAYRVFADFSVEGEPLTLATDVFVPGSFEPQPFPPPASVDRVGGYEVRLAHGPLRAEDDAELRFTVSRGGEPAAVEDYLGARGHLVALREGDLAFLHVHPEEDETAANAIPYAAAFPSSGRYRLFLQFKHEGRVRTAAFTVEVSR